MLYIASCSLILAVLPSISSASHDVPEQMASVGSKRCKLTDGCQTRSDWLREDNWLLCGNNKYPNRCRARCDGYDFDQMEPCKPCDRDPSYKSPSIDISCDCTSIPRDTKCPDCLIYEQCSAGKDNKCQWGLYNHADHRYMRCLAKCGKDGHSASYDSKSRDKFEPVGKPNFSQKDNFSKDTGFGGYEQGKSGQDYKPDIAGKDGVGKPGMGEFDKSKSSDRFLGKDGMSVYPEKQGYDGPGYDGKSDKGKQGKDDFGKQGMGGFGGDKSGYDYPQKDEYGPSGQGKQGMPSFDDNKPGQGPPGKDGYGSYDDGKSGKDYPSSMGGKDGYGSYDDGKSGKDYPPMGGKDDFGKQGMSGFGGDKSNYGPSDQGKPSQGSQDYPPMGGKDDVGKQGMGGFGGGDKSSYGPPDKGKPGMPSYDDSKPGQGPQDYRPMGGKDDYGHGNKGKDDSMGKYVENGY